MHVWERLPKSGCSFVNLFSLLFGKRDSRIVFFEEIELFLLKEKQAKFNFFLKKE